MLICAFWPIISWFDWNMTRIDTNFFALRYTLQFLYFVIMNIPYSAVDNMQMLLGDTFFLAQISSMLLFNTWSLRMQVFSIGPLLIFQNGKTVFDIVTYVKEPFQKTNFVRLISPHDSLFLVLVFTGVVQVLALLDAVCGDAVHLLNLIYVPMLMYQVVKIMDTK